MLRPPLTCYNGLASGELVEKVYAVMFMPEPKKVKWEV